jgi:hypothetical protein
MKKQANRITVELSQSNLSFVACKLASNPQYETAIPCSNYFMQTTDWIAVYFFCEQ